MQSGVAQMQVIDVTAHVLAGPGIGLADRPQVSLRLAGAALSIERVPVEVDVDLAVGVDRPGAFAFDELARLGALPGHDHLTARSTSTSTGTRSIDSAAPASRRL